MCFTRVATLATILALHAFGQNIGSLKRVTVPAPSNLDTYVRDQQALVTLGKALFWDMQAGSDGRTACASCHFHAGADHRLQNQLSGPSGTFRANQILSAADFPFHQLSNPNDNRSAVVRDTPAVAGSAGVVQRMLTEITPGSGFENAFDGTSAPTFRLSDGLNTRQVTPRNSPSVINAALNYRNFWDGRANSIFTGATPFGDSDTALNAYTYANGKLTAERIRITNASLASQAVGPIMSTVEMSYDGRTWPLLARKVLSMRPLALQQVASDDSVLGALVHGSGRGLSTTYLAMVQAAFKPAYWDGPAELAESNFAIFWGLAIQAYESTLISNDSRVDRFFDGDTTALSAQEQDGLRIFRSNQSDCTRCHTGPELTLSTYTALNARGATQRGGRGNGGGNGIDTGFFRTGVRPAIEDAGIGGLDGFGRPLSISGLTNAVQGVFKTPGLRNVEFTGPYFHNGGVSTLEQVVDFYARGGDFPNGGTGPGIGRQNLNGNDRASLVAFMKALSDDRVRFDRAPFDHPELCVPVAHNDSADAVFATSAADSWAGLSAVGRNGHAAPLQTFEELLAGTGADGSRAHTLTDACTVP